MTTYERVKRMYEHKEADRVPIIDTVWKTTKLRWQDEGMPKDVDWRDYFGIDKMQTVGIDITPRYPRKIIEETDRYVIATTPYGAVEKSFKELDSTPEVLDFKVTTPDAWEEAKARMTLDEDRIPWKSLENNFHKWKAEGRWTSALFWFGFDVTHSRLTGTETMLIAMLEEPEWVMDMFDTYLKRCEYFFDKIWNAGYHFDEVFFYDDMGYKGTPFFSPELYREVLKPYHTRAVNWAHDRGIYARLHSCGNIMPLLPDVVDTGIDALNPLEVKAGMDAFTVKETYGDRLVLHGGTNAQKWKNTDEIVEEIRATVPKLKENGGYIFASDHSIPNDVSLDTMKTIIEEAKKAGSYK